MRNTRKERRLVTFAPAGLLTLAVLALWGCANDAATKQNLNSGYTALEAKQYDEALSRADEHLRQHPTGAGSAEAFYLRGAALQQKSVSSDQAAQVNLQAARDAYQQALLHHPSATLESRIHAGLGNCAYFLNDYATAISEWTTAYDKLDDQTARAWVLYRVGVSRQRLGQFDLADQILAMVQQQYPNTVPAQRAREHQGARGFTVQLATFANPASADGAANTLRREGVLTTKQYDPTQKATVVRAGPLPSYQQALSVKQRYAAQYPDALILP
jgi:TolA-binding protein